MSVINGQSVKINVRVKNTPAQPYYDHMEKKAKSNPGNPHNHVGTEVNALIEQDFEKSKAARARKRK